MREDRIAVQILEDGTIKITTDPISTANHKSADALLKDVALLAGGPTEIERRKDKRKIARVHEHSQVRE